MKVILIFLVILHFSRSVIFSFAGDISRRIKIPQIYSFKELVRAIEEGKPLLPGIGKFVVPSPLGNRDLSHLNDVAAYYQGEGCPLLVGPVGLSIDCDYFSSMEPLHQASREEVREEIQRIVKILKGKGIKIAVLYIAISPGCTSLGLEDFVEEELLHAFSKYGND